MGKKLHKLDETYAEWTGSGSPDAFLGEVNKYAYRRAILKVKDHGRVEEIAADSMLQAWKTICKYNPARSSISTWVRLIIDSVLNDFLADRYKRAGTVEYTPETTDYLVSDAEQRIVDTSVLPDDLRSIATSLLAGYSIKETADSLGAKPSTLRKRLQRARNM